MRTRTRSVLLSVLVLVVTVPFKATAAPDPQLPWPSGQQERINDGYTYGCGGHTSANGDYYAIDFALNTGDPITAVAAGTVTQMIQSNVSYGWRVAIDHGGGYASLYAHMLSFATGVSVGVAVAQGQHLGDADSTGTVDPHLHFRMQKAGASFRAEPMSGIGLFGNWGRSLESGLGCGAYIVSPYWTSYPPGREFAADVTADARSSMVLFGADNVHVILTNGSSFGADQDWTTNPYYGSRANAVADVTGDGRADAIVVNDAGVTVRRSNGSSFTGNEAWTSNPYYGSRGTFFADATGDFKADAIVVNDDGITVRPSNGSVFAAGTLWSPPYFATRGNYFADVNQDYKADALVVSETGVTIRISSGSNFGGTQAGTTTAYFGTYGNLFADTTGDVKADAIVVGNTSITVRPSNGSLFTAGTTWYSSPFHP